MTFSKLFGQTATPREFTDFARYSAGAVGSRPEIGAGAERHSRVSTSFDIYAQIVQASQRRAIEKLSEFARQFLAFNSPLASAMPLFCS